MVDAGVMIPLIGCWDFIELGALVDAKFWLLVLILPYVSEVVFELLFVVNQLIF